MAPPKKSRRARLAQDFDVVRAGVEANVESNRERALVLTKLDEAELWLGRCAMNDEL